MVTLPKTLKELLMKQQYEFCGEHSAIKVCAWTKQSIRDEDFCYKQKFYGIKSHRCCQFSPSIGHCQNRCVFCWRPIEHTVGEKMKGKVDDPKELLDNCMKAQKHQLIGFWGNKKVSKTKLSEAIQPRHLAISLAGEPFIYPKLNQLIKEAHKRGMTTFLVTNGLLPDKLAKIEPPTQLYMSLDAPSEAIFKRVDRPVIRGAWKKLNKSLSVMKRLKRKTRTALRITLIKGINDVEPESYSKLIAKADPLFVEVKAYMFVGFSQLRLRVENMPEHEEVKSFAKRIALSSGYKIIDEKKESRVVLLMKKDFKGRKMRL